MATKTLGLDRTLLEVGSAGGGVSTLGPEEKKTTQTTREGEGPSAPSVPSTVPRASGIEPHL